MRSLTNGPLKVREINENGDKVGKRQLMIQEKRTNEVLHEWNEGVVGVVMGARKKGEIWWWTGKLDEPSEMEWKQVVIDWVSQGCRKTNATLTSMGPNH